MANKWLDDEDLKTTSRNRWLDSDDEDADYDPTKNYMQQKLERKNDSMLQSTERSLRMLQESEQLGVATAVELDRQGEVLRRTEKRVDKINEDLKQSDRHLRSIRSMWGAFVNKFSKEPPPSTLSTENGDSQVVKPKSTNPFEDDSGDVISGNSFGYDKPMTSSNNRRTPTSVENQIDDNLDLMGNSLAKLKGLGKDLHSELVAQDSILDRLNNKTIRTDNKMHATNQEMLKQLHR